MRLTNQAHNVHFWSKWPLMLLLHLWHINWSRSLHLVYFRRIFAEFLGSFFGITWHPSCHACLFYPPPPPWHHLKHSLPHLELWRLRENEEGQGAHRPHQFKLMQVTTAILRTCLWLPLPKQHSTCNRTMHKLSASSSGWRTTQRTDNVFFLTHPTM